jgi:DNA replication protein DnaC
MNIDLPETIAPAAVASEIEKRIRSAMDAHKPHQASNGPAVAPAASEALSAAGHGSRAIKALRTLHGPGFECAKSLLPAALSDGLLILIGPTGRGKTVIAAYLAAERVKAGKSAGKFLTATEMLDRIKQCWVRKEDLEPLLNGWKKTPFLVVDEAQNRSEERWDNHRFDDLINARYANELPTILIANLTLAEAQKSLGPRIMDRANECGGIVDCNWASYRI